MSEQISLNPAIPKRIFLSLEGGIESVLDTRIASKRLEKIIDTSRGENGHEISEELGFLTYHVSFSYPDKGWRDDYSVRATQLTKRSLVAWLNFVSYVLPALVILLPWRVKVIEKFIDSFHNVASLFLAPYYLHDRYYSPLTKELRKAIRIFLNEIGVRDSKSEEFSRDFATIIGYDLAYYYRLLDLFSETTAEKLTKNPRKEIYRLISLFFEREARDKMHKNFGSLVRIVTWLLFLPSVKRAFRKAIQSVQFEKMQYDDDDRKYVTDSMADGGYKFFGMTIEERNKRWPPEQHTLGEIIYGDKS